MTVLDFIMDKIREKPDQTPKLTDIETKQAQERDKQVKILVPNSTAGMIIGKGNNRWHRELKTNVSASVFSDNHSN